MLTAYSNVRFLGVEGFVGKGGPIASLCFFDSPDWEIVVFVTPVREGRLPPAVFPSPPVGSSVVLAVANLFRFACLCPKLSGRVSR